MREHTQSSRSSVLFTSNEKKKSNSEVFQVIRNRQWLMTNQTKPRNLSFFHQISTISFFLWFFFSSTAEKRIRKKLVDHRSKELHLEFCVLVLNSDTNWRNMKLYQVHHIKNFVKNNEREKKITYKMHCIAFSEENIRCIQTKWKETNKNKEWFLKNGKSILAPMFEKCSNDKKDFVSKKKMKRQKKKEEKNKKIINIEKIQRMVRVVILGFEFCSNT